MEYLPLKEASKRLGIKYDTLYRKVINKKYDDILDPLAEPEYAGADWPVFHQLKDDVKMEQYDGKRKRTVISKRLFSVIHAIEINKFDDFEKKLNSEYKSLFNEVDKNINRYIRDFANNYDDELISPESLIDKIKTEQKKLKDISTSIINTMYKAYAK